MEWVDIQAEIPALGKRPFWVPAGELKEVQAKLTALGFVRFATSGLPSESERDFLDDLRQAIGLEEYAGLNWDAFVDAFGDLMRSEKQPVAVIWKGAEKAFELDISFGLRLYEMLSSTFEDWCRAGHQVVLVLVGDRWR